MPLDKPSNDNACYTCEAIPPGAGACKGCRCPDPEFMRSGVTGWEQGYHWAPAYWTCDLCGERYAVGLYGQSIAIPDGPTICAHQECLGAILRGLEAMRKAGLCVHNREQGLHHWTQQHAQDAGAFYAELAKAGRDDG